MNWKSWLILAGVLLLSGLIVTWQLTPRVLTHHPADAELHSRQPLSVDFSQKMDPESVEAAFILTPAQTGEITWNESFDQLTFTPDEIWPPGRTVFLEIEKGLLSQVKLPMLNPYTATLKVSPYLLTYLWPAEGPSNLYVAHTESGESQALTGESAGVLDYFVPPDGSSIYYSRPGEGGSSAILVLDRETGRTSTVIDCPKSLCRSPQISPDGVYLAYEFISREAGSLPTVRVFHLEDHNTLDPGETSQYLEMPVWGSSGWLAMYNQTQKGYQFWQPDTNRTLFLANDTEGDGSWSADGRYFISSRIQFTSQTLAPRQLLLFDTWEETLLDLSGDSFLENLNPSFAPFGMRVAYSSKSLDPENWTPGRQLWVMDIDTGDNQQLTDSDDYHHSSFTWHPDGEKLAYVRYNQATLSEPPEIWIINKDGTGKLRLIIDGYAPGWIP